MCVFPPCQTHLLVLLYYFIDSIGFSTYTILLSVNKNIVLLPFQCACCVFNVNLLSSVCFFIPTNILELCFGTWLSYRIFQTMRCTPPAPKA